LCNGRDEKLQLLKQLSRRLDVRVRFGVLRQIVKAETARNDHDEHPVQFARDFKNGLAEVLKLKLMGFGVHDHRLLLSVKKGPDLGHHFQVVFPYFVKVCFLHVEFFPRLFSHHIEVEP